SGDLGLRRGEARVWDLDTGEPKGPAFLHRGVVGAVAFSPDGRTALTGSHDKTAQLWDVETGEPLGPALGHQGEVRAVAFSPDGRTALTGSHDKTARLWDVPPSLQGEAKQLLLWTQVLTGMELDERGRPRELSLQAWCERRRELQQRGGPPRP